jgi:hypothetical protein
MRTFVSTNVLSLVPLVTRHPDPSSQAKPVVEQSGRLSPRLLVCISLAHEVLDMFGKQATD